MGEQHSIQRLLLETKNGNKKSEKILFEIIIVRLRYLAKKKINGEDANDIAMDACKTVFEKLESVDLEKGNFESWILKILRNKIGNYLQKMKTVTDKLGDPVELDQVKSGFNEENRLHLKMTLQECLKKIIDRFPNYARVLNLVNQGYLVDEICDKLKINQAYYYVLLRRCRSVLFKCVEEGDL